jgi:hypothetical protein
VNFLEASFIHLLANNVLNIAKSNDAKWKPRVNARCDSANVSGTNKQSVTWYFSICWVITERA